MGNGPVRVVLYDRLSTAAQADEGYASEGHLRELRAEMAKTGRQIVDVVTESGKKRHVYDRPGVRRLLELAARGTMDEVWAYRWDRYGKGSVTMRIEEDLGDLGVKVRALGDGGEGKGGRYYRAFGGVNSDLEQEEQAEKTRMGRREKARKGKVVGGGRNPRYGFRHVRNDKGKVVGYEIMPGEMRVVVRVMDELAAGASVRSVQSGLEKDGVPAPRGGARWGRDTIRKIVNEDAYRPHSPEELTLLVAEGPLSQEVHGNLDPKKPYGIDYYGRTRSRFLSRATDKRVVESAPRSEWVAVPVCLEGAGLDQATVDAARKLLVDNRTGSTAGKREDWELSRGFLFCADCGRSMNAIVTSDPRYGLSYHYYACPEPRGARPAAPSRCKNRKSHPKDDLEDKAWMLFGTFADPEKLDALYDEREGKKGNEERAAVLMERLGALTRKRAGFQDQQAEGLMTLDELRTRLTDLDDEREKISAELALARDAAATREQIDTALAAFLEFRRTGGFFVNDSPEERRAAYRRLGARFDVDRDGLLTLRFDLEVAVENATVELPFVREKTTSSSTATSRTSPSPAPGSTSSAWR